MVSLRSPYQARLFQYYATFGRSEFAALVVSGETGDKRREFVDRFEAELAKLPELQGRVLGKVTLDHVAETLLVWHPELAKLLPQAGAALEPGRDPWLSWAQAAERRLGHELEGSGDASAEAARPAGQQGPQALGRLADALRALRLALAADGRLAIGELGIKNGGSQIDEHGYLVGGQAVATTSC